MDLNHFDGLLQWEALQLWIETSDVPGSGAVMAVEQLTGGSQNNIFKLTRADGTLSVLRRPPRHLRAKSNDTMLREARVLSALRGSGVPHPEFFDVCAELDVIGTTFYVMGAIDGFTPMGTLPGQYATDSHWQRRFGEELVEGAAKLGAVDYVRAGLADFGKAEQWVERQAPRWRAHLESYSQLAGYGKPDIPNVDRVGDWLTANQPSSCTIGIIHGDYQFANVMFAHDAPRLAAMVDWELSTLGDPLLDLAWMMQAWSEPGDPEGKPSQVPWIQGQATRAELVAHYGAVSGRDMSDYPWYFTLACYRLGIILEGTHARAIAGQAPKEFGDLLHAYTLWLFAMANQWITRH